MVCASGAGRSAALIAADICARALASGSADLPRTVRALRTQRPHSLTNRHHYIFLYKVMFMLKIKKNALTFQTFSNFAYNPTFDFRWNNTCLNIEGIENHAPFEWVRKSLLVMQLRIVRGFRSDSWENKSFCNILKVDHPLVMKTANIYTLHLIFLSLQLLSEYGNRLMGGGIDTI